MEWQYWQHVAQFPHVNILHANSLHRVADDLRYLIISRCSYHKDICHIDRLAEQTISPSSRIPFSHEKLVTMLDLVEGIVCRVPFNLTISYIHYSVASPAPNWTSSSNVFVVGMICTLFAHWILSLMFSLSAQIAAELSMFPIFIFADLLLKYC